MSVSPRVQCAGCKKYFSSTSKHFSVCEQMDHPEKADLTEEGHSMDVTLPESEVHRW